MKGNIYEENIINSFKNNWCDNFRELPGSPDLP